MVQLKCENLTIGYDKKIILSNLSFEINKGDYLCIVGENGSGKSTLVENIFMALNEHPDVKWVNFPLVSNFTG